jgi:uncharacterized protein
MRSPHIAIGTSAVAVSLSALSSLAGHARAGNVRWPCATVFALSGVAGAAAGSTIGKLIDGQKLLGLFGVLMLIVAVLTARKREGDDSRFRPLTSSNFGSLGLKLAAFGVAAGFASGFFGIGGGFLVVPGLIAAAHLPVLEAVGSSLVSITAFGATTAANYGLSGLVDWRIAALFVAGGAIGSFAGVHVAGHLAKQKQLLARLFAGLVAGVGLYLAISSFARALAA